MPLHLRSFRPALAALAAAGLLTGVLSACGSSDGDTPSPSASGSSSVAASSSTPSASATTIPTTDPGTDLKLKQAATFEWTAKQGVTGLLRVKVTSLESTTYKQTFSGWKIPDEYKARAPYFVRAKVTNVGKARLGGYDVPLYGLDSDDNLVEATSFGSDFSACQPKTLPKKFGPGKSADVCLVILTPDKNALVGVSYRPDEKFDPITWTGKVVPYAPAKKAPKAKGTAKKGKRG